MLVSPAIFSQVTIDFANCDHEASAKAIAKGLSARTEPSFWIHTSGTLILGCETMDKGCFGQLLPKVFDDWDGVGELTSQPDHVSSPVHRIVHVNQRLDPQRTQVREGRGGVSNK